MIQTPIQNMDPQDLADFSSRHKETDYMLVDVRQPQEYTQEHIPGARLIPLHELEGRLAELDPEKKTIFYCRSGKRSMSAAILAMDSGFFTSEIFNLLGGISAYQGTVLPDYPRVNIFHQERDLKSVIKRAVSLEKGASKFYSELQAILDNDSLKKQIQKLAKLEKSHARVVFQQGKDLFELDFQGLYDSVPDDIVEGGLQTSAIVHQFQGADQGELCSHLLEIALDIETMAYDMYRNLAEEQAFSRDATECFFRLSEQEKGHIRLIARLFNDCR